MFWDTSQKWNENLYIFFLFIYFTRSFWNSFWFLYRAYWNIKRTRTVFIVKFSICYLSVVGFSPLNLWIDTQIDALSISNGVTACDGNALFFVFSLLLITRFETTTMHSSKYSRILCDVCVHKSCIYTMHMFNWRNKLLDVP